MQRKGAAFPRRLRARGPVTASGTSVRGQRHRAAGGHFADMVFKSDGDGIGVVGHDVIGTGEDAIVDGDVLLGVELVDELAHGWFGDEFVTVAMHKQSAAGAGGEEAEIIMVGGRSDADPAGDFGAAHQKLHADEGTEGVAGDPEPAGRGVNGLHPVKRCGGITDFTDAAIVTALAAANAAKIEAHHREAELFEALEHCIGDAVVHRSAMQRMGVEDERERGAGLLGMVVATFKPTVWAGEHDFWHRVPKSVCC